MHCETVKFGNQLSQFVRRLLRVAQNSGFACYYRITQRDLRSVSARNSCAWRL